MPQKVTSLLQRQHREVMKLFREAETAETPSAARQACRQIIEKLKLHTELEEELFYPALRQHGGKKAEEMVLEAYEEHHVVDLVLAELPKADPGDETFKAKLTVLRELVKHHVDEEEQEMFKLAEKLGTKELEAIGAEVRERIGNGAPA